MLAPLPNPQKLRVSLRVFVGPQALVVQIPNARQATATSTSNSATPIPPSVSPSSLRALRVPQKRHSGAGLSNGVRGRHAPQTSESEPRNLDAGPQSQDAVPFWSDFLPQRFDAGAQRYGAVPRSLGAGAQRSETGARGSDTEGLRYSPLPPRYPPYLGGTPLAPQDSTPCRKLSVPSDFVSTPIRFASASSDFASAPTEKDSVFSEIESEPRLFERTPGLCWRIPTLFGSKLLVGVSDVGRPASPPRGYGRGGGHGGSRWGGAPPTDVPWPTVF